MATGIVNVKVCMTTCCSTNVLGIAREDTMPLPTKKKKIAHENGRLDFSTMRNLSTSTTRVIAGPRCPSQPEIVSADKYCFKLKKKMLNTRKELPSKNSFYRIYDACLS
jgi:hypothetical protein